MYPIIGCSIISLAIFLEKIWGLRKNRIIPEKLVINIFKLCADGKYEELKGLCKANNTPPAIICEQLLRKKDEGVQVLKEIAIDTGKNMVFYMEKYLEGMSTIANVSTLLGLLGTISGMIKIFSVISAEPVVDPAKLAGGISEALYTTAAGLTVAIPTFIGYKYLSGKVMKLTIALEEYASDLLEHLAKK